MDKVSFGKVLETLLSPDNNARKAAESAYDEFLQKDPNMASERLSECLVESSSNGVRGLAAVLLRQLIRKTELWDRVESSRVKTGVQRALVTSLEQEKDSRVGRKIIHALVGFPKEELREMKDLVPWTIAFLGQCEKSIRPVALFLLGKLAEFAYPLVEESLQNVVQVLQNCLVQEEDLESRLAASEATCSLTLSSPKPSELYPFLEDAIPLMVRGILSGIDESTGPETHDLATKSLQSLQALTQKTMQAMDKSLGPTCLTLLQIADNGNLDDESRCLALQVFVEIYSKRGKSISKDAAFMQNVIQLLLRLQCEDITWADDWRDNMTVLPDDMLLSSAPGLRGLSIYALCVIAEHQTNLEGFLENVFKVIGPALESREWKERMAAITVVGALAKPAGKVLTKHLDSILPSIFRLFQDEERRVVFGFVAALHEMIQADSMKGSFSAEEYPQRAADVLEVLAFILESPTTVPVVACAALQCLAGFLQADMETVSEIEESQQRRFLQIIVRCLTQGTVPMKEDALITLSALALFIGASFAQFYDDLVPGIKQYITNPETAMNSTSAGEAGIKADELRAAAMSCIGSIAGAVGKERFAKDADEILNLLLRSEVSKLSELDGIYTFFIKVSSVLGSDFVRYLDRALPIVFAGVQCSTGVTVEDVLDQDNASSSNMQDLSQFNPDVDGKVSLVKEMRGAGAFRVTANLFAFQARIDALACIQAFADALGADLAPYLEKCFQVVLPAINDHLNIDASINAAEAAASLLKCTWESLFRTGHSMEPAQKLLVTIAVALLSSLQKASDPSDELDPGEFDTGVVQRAGFASSFERCMRICYTSGAEETDDQGKWPPPVLIPPLQVLPHWIQILRDVYLLSVNRRVRAADALAEEGYQEEDIEEMMAEVNEDEEEFSRDIIDSIGWIIKTVKAQVLPLFQELLHPTMSVLLQSDNMPEVQNNAICMYIDLLQSCGPDASQYLDMCVSLMSQWVSTKNDALRQSCAYGLAQVAEFHPEYFSSRAQSVAEALANLVHERRGVEKQDNDDEEDYVLDNAVSALGKIIKFHAQKVDSARFFNLWLFNLPLTHDEEEAKTSHRFLVETIARQDPALSQTENAEQVMRVLCTLNDKVNERQQSCGGGSDQDEPELVDPGTSEALPKVLESFFKALAPDVQNNIKRQLEPKLAAMLH